MTRATRWAAAAAGALLALAAGAGELPRLPADHDMPRSGQSPGQVTFRHSSHVDSDKPACLGCHPRRFSILATAGAPRAAAITHEAMEKGEACGACHGKKAFGLDECGNCHAQ